jgi:hypothetical protein
MADIRGAQKVEGSDASDAAISQNPIVIAGRASDAVVTPVSADGDVVALWVSRRGAIMTADAPHIPFDGAPFSLINKNAQYGGAQTGAALWTPGSGKKIAILAFDITVSGTAASDVALWYGASGDTAFTVGTDSAVFYGNFIPSSAISPGVSRGGVWLSPTADHILRFTAGGANTYYVNTWGYEF